MHIISEEQIRQNVREPQAREAAEIAFRALAQSAATVPQPIALSIHDHNGELHIKCAYLHGSRFFVVKAATGFYDNPTHGLPSGSGLMLLFDATTGFPFALLQDNGYLTELRTAAAGALAARLLAVRNFKHLAVIGAGAQARYQLRAFDDAFQWARTTVWSRSLERAEKLCDEVQLRSELRAATSVEAAVRGADVVVTVTPSEKPIVRGEWLEPHATVIAVGADGPEKNELDASVFAHAGRVVVDSIPQCARLGELHHAVKSGFIKLEDCTELGDILAGRKIGRIGHELIVCDLTGLGAQDAAIAELAYRACIAETAGREI